ncbi:MAG: TonB-dependent receptor, partial [Gemmatimonadaceae bacterium]|nr:TonB-dependent receptor [Gemmatimonadaceae bacterium]
AAAQSTAPDTSKPHPIEGVTVTGRRHAEPVGALPEVQGTLLYSGKKTEVVRLDSLTINTAQDVTRELLARVPGANISETENAGFPSNGIAFRGLNPVQSVEMNTRQDGVNIVADLYGYPETYYTPPAEAVERVELVRGSSSLQFGPQFGGVVNYVLRDGTPNTPPTFFARQTAGSFGLYNSYLSVSGGTSAWTYYAYAQYRGQQGWRPNSDLRQVSGAARVRYRASDRLRFGLEYTMLRNRIHMPGGLDNEAFNADSRQSFRARNWLASPWNILALTGELDLSPRTRLTSTASYLFSQRYLVWRNEDGGAGGLDTIDPATLAFTPREVERESFDNFTSETRLATTYDLFGASHTLATGVRVFAGTLHRQAGGPGSTGSDFDMSLVGGPYETDVRFDNANVAVFAENTFHIGPHLALTPGVRVEYLHSTARGYTDTTFAPQRKDRTFALAGIGAQYSVSRTTDLYANITQAYRPIEYSFLTPFASLTRIDPHLKDPKGFNADLGWRGSLGDVASFDLGLFYLAYHDRIGLVSGVDSTGAVFTERRNIANSVHKGAEAYVELHPLALLGAPASWGTIGVFDALGYTHARYTSGELAGRRVEYAPDVVNRLGVTYARGPFSTTFQWSAVSKQFADANNTVASYDANVGVIPAYRLLDWSGKYRVSDRATVSAGVNNIANVSYFTMRTTEYPGPGIIPGTGRSVYATLSTGF